MQYRPECRDNQQEISFMKSDSPDTDDTRKHLEINSLYILLFSIHFVNVRY